VRVLVLDNLSCSECPINDIADIPRGRMTVIDVGISRIKLCAPHLRDLKTRLSKRGQDSDGDQG
jgi:hypothetical protein